MKNKGYNFLKLISFIKKKYKINERIIREIIFFCSKKVKNISDLLDKKNENVDFSISNFKKLIRRYVNHEPIDCITKYAMFCQKKFIVKDNICHLDACKTVRFG
jgi:hypothetical protein